MVIIIDIPEEVVKEIVPPGGEKLVELGIKGLVGNWLKENYPDKESIRRYADSMFGKEDAKDFLSSFGDMMNNIVDGLD